MTPEEFLAIPEQRPYLEYVAGIAFQKPANSRLRIETLHEIVYHLGMWKESHGGRAGISAQIRLGPGPDYRLPDLCFWRPELPRGRGCTPSLAVDILSPDQVSGELRARARFFRSTGVETCWLIDPVSRTAEIFEGRKKSGTLTTTPKAECLPGFEFPLADLFAILD